MPLSRHRFSPRVDLTPRRGGVNSRSGDWNTTVMANPTGTYHRSSAGTTSDELGFLDEADVRSSGGQTPAVHEFGHSIGLEHPGRGSPGLRNSVASTNTPGPTSTGGRWPEAI